MSKSFQLVGLERPVPSTSTHTTQTNWKLCTICQEDKSESVTSPSKSKRKDSGSGYSSFAANLSRFSELGQLSGTLQLERLNEGCGIEAAMVTNNALYPQACKLKYLQRAEKRTFVTEGEINAHQVRANAPDFIQDHPVQRRPKKSSVYSAYSIRRNKLKVFNTSSPRSVSKGKQQLASLRNDVTLFSWLYIGCQTRDGNLEEFFRHENQACPPALSDGESLRLGTKSDLLKYFEELSSAQSEVPDTTCLVLGGAVIVQMLKPAVAKNVDDYTHDVFIPYLSSKLQTVSRLDLVWDRYIADSLKGSAR